MKRLFLLAKAMIAGVIFCSCSTAKVYYQPFTQAPRAPWQGSSGKWGGYQETRLGGSGAREIRYTAYNKPSPEVAEYFCLVRAAECSLLDGKDEFWVSGVKTGTEIATSNFPEQMIAGHSELVPYRHYYRGPNGERMSDIHYRREWYPPEYYPPYAVVNQIHTSRLQMTYRAQSGGKHYVAREVLQGALDDHAKLGIPKLDKTVMEILSKK